MTIIPTHLRYVSLRYKQALRKSLSLKINIFCYYQKCQLTKTLSSFCKHCHRARVRSFADHSHNDWVASSTFRRISDWSCVVLRLTESLKIHWHCIFRLFRIVLKCGLAGLAAVVFSQKWSWHKNPERSILWNLVPLWWIVSSGRIVSSGASEHYQRNYLESIERSCSKLVNWQKKVTVSCDSCTKQWFWLLKRCVVSLYFVL